MTIALRATSRSTRLAFATAALGLALGACSSGTPTSDSTNPETSSSVVSNAGGVLRVTGTAALKFDPPNLEADAGEVTFELHALGAVHNIVIEGINGDEPIVEAQIDETKSAAIGLTASDTPYVFYCNITGHREAGMEGLLTVS